MEIKRMQEKSYKVEQEMPAAEPRMIKDFERKFKEFTGALQIVLATVPNYRSGSVPVLNHPCNGPAQSQAVPTRNRTGPARFWWNSSLKLSLQLCI
jgi:hypothetical protein